MTPGRQPAVPATAKGERRRVALRAAATAVLEEEGFAAVTYRAVAARARTPVASVAYYFATCDQLLYDAVRELARAQLAGADAVLERLPERADAEAGAAAVTAMLVGDAVPSRLLSLYERYLQAGRRPAVAALVRDWNSELEERIAEALRRAGSPAPAATVLALADGVALRALAEASEDVVGVLRTELAAALRAG